MKRIALVFSLLPIFLSACDDVQIPSTATKTIILINATSPIPATLPPTLTLVDSAETWGAIEPFADLLKVNYLSRGYIISPDGQWLVNANGWNESLQEQTITFHLVSISNPKFTIDHSYTDPWAYGFRSWSPDGSAFVGITVDPKNVSGRDDCCGEGIVISHVQDGEIKQYSFYWGWNENPYIYWSYDGSKIGIVFPSKGLWIVDTHGNLLGKIELAGIDSLLWEKDSVFAGVYKNNHNNIYIIDPEKFTFELTSDDIDNRGIYFLIDYNAEANQIFLHREYYYHGANDISRKDDFFLFDLNSKTINQLNFSIDTQVHALETSPSHNYIAIKISRTMMNSPNDYLWIFDWQKQTFNYFGQITDLFGWFTTINGFHVKTEAGDFKVIRP
jgi:hypothetical protein